MTMTPLSENLRGILLPATTPFNPDSSLDKQSLASNLSQWNKTGISGYAMLGSTGERMHLDEREFVAVVEQARFVVPGNMAFIVGAGQQSTRVTINEINTAANIGADAVLVITPFFYRTAITQQTLIDYYTAVADGSSVPVLLYSMPALTGVKIEPETIARLAVHQNIIGAKDSSNDIAGFRKTVELCPPDFALMTGNGTVLLDALKAGATGGILAVGCAVPEVCVEVLRTFRANEVERAEGLQTKLTPFAAAVTTKYGIGGLKAALDMRGYVGGAVRAPLSGPSDEARAEIKELLTEASAELETIPTTHIDA
ncbi:MAG: dihydrodipicolinate synthase family protein [Blastocatellia bacterium]|nr:MAG: dihydrodipicolinate synthase family protein [Blastocatellia bacterium]